MGGIKNFTFKDYYNVARLEYLPAEAPAVLIPLFLTATTLMDLFNLLYFEALLAFALLYFSGFIINSYTDVNVDQLHKIYVATSSKKLGPKMLKNLVIIQVASAIVLIIHISIIINALWLIPICLLGIFMGLAYSVKPFEFKVKGVMHTVSLMISAFLVPLILLFTAVNSNFAWYIILLSIGFPLAHYGIALANQTGDFLEDRSEGLQSPAVKWGLNRTLKMAKLMAIIGLGIELIAIWGLVWVAPWISELESILGLPFSARYLLIAIVTTVMVLGYSISIRGLFTLHNISKWDTAIENKMKRIKEIMNYPIWQASAIWGLVVTSIIISVLNIGLAG